MAASRQINPQSKHLRLTFCPFWTQYARFWNVLYLRSHCGSGCTTRESEPNTFAGLMQSLLLLMQLSQADTFLPLDFAKVQRLDAVRSRKLFKQRSSLRVAQGFCWRMVL